MPKKFLQLITLLIFITWIGCREEQDSINSPTASVKLEKAGSVQLSFNKSGAVNSQVEDVDTVTALLTRSGFESVKKDIAIGEGVATGTIFNVAEGKWLLTIDAKDSTGTAIYRGRTDVEILSNQTTYVSIELAPAESSGDLAINVSWNEGDGISWTKYSENPVLDLGQNGSWDDYHITHPTAIYNGTNYEMWYTGYDGNNYRIGYAYSSDGINWTKYSGNPVINLGTTGAWDETSVSTPSVIYNGLTYEMWYAGSNNSSISQIGYATSTDGINWTKHSGNPILTIGSSSTWESNNIGNPSVLFNGSKYELWYSGFDGTNYRIGYASSTNGTSWTKYSDNPVLNIGAPGSWDDRYLISPSVIFDGNNYQTWYSGLSNTYFRIGYASSIDGINWVKNSENPIIDVGTTGTWDASGLSSSTVLYNGISYKLWFVGSDGTNQRIGYATSP